MEFANHPTTKRISQKTVWIFIDLPGQSQDSGDLPEGSVLLPCVKLSCQAKAEIRQNGDMTWRVHVQVYHASDAWNRWWSCHHSDGAQVSKFTVTLLPQLIFLCGIINALALVQLMFETLLFVKDNEQHANCKKHSGYYSHQHGYINRPTKAYHKKCSKIITGSSGWH